LERFPPDLALTDAYWISVDPELPFAVWNKDVGVYASAAWTTATFDSSFRKRYIEGQIDYLMFEQNPNFDGGAMSAYLKGVTTEYMVEYNAEQARRQVDPKVPSRLSAVYAFGTKADAVRAANAAGRPKWEVYAFALNDLPLTRVARVNMNIVSLVRLGTRVGTWDPETIDAIWRHYWNGGGELTFELPSGPGFKRVRHESGVVWEFLIEGRLEMLKRRD
jgi:hypothetical protein